MGDPYVQALKAMRRGGASLEKVAAQLQASHVSGNANAAYALATWYLHGTFFKKDLKRAIRLLRQAAKAGVADALYDLAVCYETGEGVVKNPPKAFSLYLGAALLGERQSIYEVGRCYFYGIGVERDRNVARVWLDRAHELGVD